MAAKMTGDEVRQKKEGTREAHCLGICIRFPPFVYHRCVRCLLKWRFISAIARGENIKFVLLIVFLKVWSLAYGRGSRNKGYDLELNFISHLSWSFHCFTFRFAVHLLDHLYI